MKTRRSMLVALLLMATIVLPVTAQDHDRDGRYDRDSHNNQRFYQGVRNGGRGGQYSDPRYENRQYDNRYHSRYNNGAYSNRYNNQQYNNGYYSNQGGIGPGKGALIGGAGGAVLGAVFGKSLKGAIVGGAAGAGIGAVVGEVHQKNQQNQYYPR